MNSAVPGAGFGVRRQSRTVKRSEPRTLTGAEPRTCNREPRTPNVNCEHEPGTLKLEPGTAVRP